MPLVATQTPPPRIQLRLSPLSSLLIRRQRAEPIATSSMLILSPQPQADRPQHFGDEAKGAQPSLEHFSHTFSRLHIRCNNLLGPPSRVPRGGLAIIRLDVATRAALPPSPQTLRSCRKRTRYRGTVMGARAILQRKRNKISVKWRSGRDSNPRYAFGVYSLSRRAPSTTRPPLRMPFSGVRPRLGPRR